MSSVLVVGPRELRPGDVIVGVQRHGTHDPVVPRNKIVDLAVREHPVIGGECIRIRRPAGESDYEMNLWNGNEYHDETLFHIQRP